MEAGEQHVEQLVGSSAPKAEIGNINQQDENDIARRKRKRGRDAPVLPRMLKNDIRRFYAPMFMNSINSGDLHMMQDFFYTFMTGSCRIVGDQFTRPELNTPDRIIGEGPIHTAHYMLGTFLMYPDLVTKMLSCSITTSNAWKGTKITLGLEVLGTKVATLPTEVWMPHKKALPHIYQQPTVHHMVQLVHSVVPNYYDFSTRMYRNPAIERPDWPSVTVMAAEDSSEYLQGTYFPNQPSLNCNTTDITNAVMQQGAADGFDNDILLGVPSAVSYSIQSIQAELTTGTSTSSSSSSSGEPSSSSSVHHPHAGSDTKNTGAVEAGGVKSLCNNRAYIPASFIAVLCEGLCPLTRPLPYRGVGKVEFYLDENNHVQLFNLTLVETNSHGSSGQQQQHQVATGIDTLDPVDTLDSAELNPASTLGGARVDAATGTADGHECAYGCS